MNRIPDQTASSVTMEGERSIESLVVEARRKGIGGTAGRQPRKPKAEPSRSGALVRVMTDEERAEIEQMHVDVAIKRQNEESRHHTANAMAEEIRAAGPSHPLYVLAQSFAAHSPTTTQQETRSHMSIITPTTTARTPSNIIGELVRNAENAQPYSVEYDGNGDVRRVTPQPHGDIKQISLRALSFPVLDGATDHTTYIPRGTEAGKASTMATEIARRAVTASAGANIVLIPTAPTPQGGVTVTRTNSGLIVVNPANVIPVIDGQEVAVSDLPFLRADVDRSEIPSLGVRFNLPRSLQRQYFTGQLPDILLAAIGQGIANALDKTLLGALDAADLGAFSLGAAAAKSLTFGELRGVIGTTGTGALVDSSNGLAVGVGTAGGIRAELTSQTTNTYVAAWDRMGIALMDEITLIAQKNSAVTGEMTVTAWLNAAPLVSDASYAWKVGA